MGQSYVNLWLDLSLDLCLDFKVNCQCYVLELWVDLFYNHLSCAILKLYVNCWFVWHFFCVGFVNGQPLLGISMSNMPKSPIPTKNDMQVENRLVIGTSYTFTLIDLYTFQIETNNFFWKHVQMKAHYGGVNLSTFTCA